MVGDVLTKENINDCWRPPLAIASRIFGRCSPSDRNLLKPTIQYLISLGVDVHRGPEVMFTSLDLILEETDCPWDSLSIGKEWLDILIESRIDVMEYLRTKYRLHFDPSRSLPMLCSKWDFDYRARYLIISEEPPSISWDWFIDGEGNAFEVLEEFKKFGPGGHDICWEHRWPSSMYNWPFFYSRWHLLAEYIRSLSRAGIAAVQLAEERFERRWHKKARKTARTQGVIHRSPKIPGAWID